MKDLIFDIVKKSKKEVIIKVITSLFVRGLLLIIPIYWSKTINYLTDNRINNAYYLVVLILLLSILYYGWEYLNQRSWFKFYDKLYMEYTNIVIKNDNNFDKITFAEFINIINNDIDIICTFMGNSITRIIQIFEFLFIYSYFFSINIYIFIITIIISLIMVMLLLVSGNTVQNSNMKRKNTLDKKTIMADNIFSSKKSQEKADSINDFFNSTNSYLNANFKYNMLTNGIIYIMLACIEMSQYGVIFYGIYLVSQAKMEIGTIVLIYTYYTKILGNFQVLGTISADYRSFVVSLKRLNRLKNE